MSEARMDRVRRRLRFYGAVQGVGFRWNALHIARRYSVSGWVRNLYDGTVEMEAEGTERDISDLVEAMENHSWGSVERIESERVPVHGDYSFEVR